MRSRRSAVFLDRDGVLNANVVREGVPSPPRSVEELELIEGVAEAVESLRGAGYVLIVVTNQPDVARGTLQLATVEAIDEALRSMIALDDVMVCVHDDSDNCDCRKPKPGMLLQAIETFNIDPATSYMVGDRWRDISAGHSAGCRTVLVGDLDEGLMPDAPTARLANLYEAARWILGSESGVRDS